MKPILNKFYVYIYKHPITKLPFYVGKGKNSRYMHHMSPCMLSDKSFKTKTILKIFTNGMLPEIELIYCETEQDAFDLEISLITKYKKVKDGGSLTNHLDGGDSPPENKGISHSQFGKSGKFKLTNLTTNESEEVIGIYFWAKQHNLNGTALVEIADKKPLSKPNGKQAIRKQHKGWLCERVN
jgi:hypothetical protein